jgi:hypothetical protein
MLNLYITEPFAELDLPPLNSSETNESLPLNVFLRDLGMLIGKRIENGTNADPKLIYTIHYSATEEASNDNLEKVLKMVTDQTGLTFKTEKRKLRLLFVEKIDK